ncbi:MAG: leucine-rich repeat domain-containing protein, partial [Cytophagales bacterium]
LRDLPSEFGELKNLKALYLRNNYFESVPVSITRLNNLKILDLSVNQLTSLPIEIANLKNLDELILVGNKIPPSEQKKIQALLPNTKIYFDKEN